MALWFKDLPIPTICVPNTHRGAYETHWLFVSTNVKLSYVYDVDANIRDIFFQQSYDGVSKGILSVSENPHGRPHRLFSDWDFEQNGIPMGMRREILDEAMILYKKISKGKYVLIPESRIELIPVTFQLDINIKTGNAHLKTNIQVTDDTRRRCNKWVKSELAKKYPDAVDALDNSTGVRMIYSGKYTKVKPIQVTLDTSQAYNECIDCTSVYVPVDINYDFKQLPVLTMPNEVEFVKSCCTRSVYNINNTVDVTEYEMIKHELGITTDFTTSTGEVIQINLEKISHTRTKMSANRDTLSTIITNDDMEYNDDSPEVVDDSVWADIIKIARPIMVDFTEPKLARGNDILRYSRKRSSFCLICEREHDSNGAYITHRSRTGAIELRCYQNDEKYLIIGYTGGDEEGFMEAFDITPGPRPMGIQYRRQPARIGTSSISRANTLETKAPPIVNAITLLGDSAVYKLPTDTPINTTFIDAPSGPIQNYLRRVNAVINLTGYTFESVNGKLVDLIADCGAKCPLCGKSDDICGNLTIDVNNGTMTCTNNQVSFT